MIEIGQTSKESSTTINVIKRDGTVVPFNFEKIKNAVNKAFNAVYNSDAPEEFIDYLSAASMTFEPNMSVEEIQKFVIYSLGEFKYYDVQIAYTEYRYKHAEERLRRDRILYMKNYQLNGENAATSSASDPNANMNLKNVANMESEVYKLENRKTQRIMLYDEIEHLYGRELADQFLKDLESHLTYDHDEASSPVIKNYCEAVTLYPLLEGTDSLDGTGTKAPKHLDSFCGQLVNATFLLASQCKGAVAFGEFFNFFDHFAAMDYGEDYDLNEDVLVETSAMRHPKTIGEKIEQEFQYIVCNWNQPAGNRGAQSPFTNISYYDENYWHALFDEFAFPDGSKPVWRRVDYLQRKFIKWFNDYRKKTLLTFPVETMALLTDGKDVIDKSYKHLTAHMYAEGHSFFTYLSDNPDSLASCCRLRNQINNNVFSFTNGLTGVQTGSCNVITINLNRLVQDAVQPNHDLGAAFNDIQEYLTEVVERVHKYHIAYKTMLYEWEANGMFTASNAGYISMSKLYSTVGLNGINEAAEFLGIKCSYNPDYIALCQLITGTISKLNKKNSTKQFMFNTEFVPKRSGDVKPLLIDSKLLILGQRGASREIVQRERLNKVAA